VLESRRLRVGELVLAIGNPLRLERSVSLGVVSAVDRVLPGGRGRALEGLLQTDAAINPGSSGGPLLDAEGAVAGVTTAMIPFARGIGFAVPAHTVSWVVPLLLQKGRVARPLLGISARGLELSQLQTLELGQPRAVSILDVAPGEPAERAGLRPHDLVLRVNGNPVSGVDDIVRALVFGEGRELELEFLRNGERKTMRATPRLDRRAA
jgi:S1-C subfamily serine protease